MRIAFINEVAVAAPPDAVGYKYADGVEPAAWIYDEDELTLLVEQDPKLIAPVVHRDAIDLARRPLVIDVTFAAKPSAVWGPFETRPLSERAVVGLACRSDVLEAKIRPADPAETINRREQHGR